MRETHCDSTNQELVEEQQKKQIVSFRLDCTSCLIMQAQKTFKIGIKLIMDDLIKL